MRYKRGYYDVFIRTCAKHPSRIAVRLYEDGTYKNYTYSELYGVCEYISQNLQQLKCNKGIIALVSERNILIPCFIAAAHKSCTTFMFINPSQDIEALVKDIAFTIIITIKKMSNSFSSSEMFGKKPDKTVVIFDLVINMYNCSPPSYQDHILLNHHSFIATTSGSTGNPKHIQVPIQCIQPNIDDLTKMFEIIPQDIIYFSTPLTFDPSMVEILLACLNGASLLIAPDKADILFPADKSNSITFWQTTPSRFFQHSNADIKNKILSADSTLKVLALGGEPLNGVKRLKELKDRDNKTRIFTLYGVTEMSCWACAAELDLNKILTDREVPLGDCLSETEVVVEPTKENYPGKIILVSKTRNCYILAKSKGSEEQNSMKFVDTGDLGVKKNGTIYYRGRKDDIIKRFGHKVNLQLIESTIMQCPKIKTCSCVWIPKPMLLIVYFSSETLSSLELSDFLKCKLDSKHWPDKVMRVDNLPTNNHGKISKQMIAKMHEKFLVTQQTPSKAKSVVLGTVNSVIDESLLKSAKPASSIYNESPIRSTISPIKETMTVLHFEQDPPRNAPPSRSLSIESLKTIFLKELHISMNKVYTYEQIKDKDFYAIGGTSFLAVTMCNKISLVSEQFGKFILPYLMSHRYTIGEIMEMVKKETEICFEETKPKRVRNRFKRSRSSMLQCANETYSEFASSSKVTICNRLAEKNNSGNFVVEWTYDTGKCVDASPTLFQTGFDLYVTVGSHSGKIVAMDAISGTLHGVIGMDARVEAPVLCREGSGGTWGAGAGAPCGAVGAHDGTVLCYTLAGCRELWRTNIGSMIKSKAVYCNGLLYVASYDGKLRCLDIMTGAVKLTINVSEQAISAGLVLAKKEYILLGTLSGACASVQTATNAVVWRETLASPVFATPVLYDDDKYVVFAEVNGEIHCRTVEKGIKIWKYKGAKGNIFSSLYMKKVDKLRWQMVFGCYDNYVYSVIIKNFLPSLHWKVEMISPVYSTPCGFRDKFILAASNSGQLCVIDADDGIIVAQYQLPKETFSSPATYGDYIFIGCRDDLLYSLKFTSSL